MADKTQPQKPAPADALHIQQSDLKAASDKHEKRHGPGHKHPHEPMAHEPHPKHPHVPHPPHAPYKPHEPHEPHDLHHRHPRKGGAAPEDREELAAPAKK